MVCEYELYKSYKKKKEKVLILVLMEDGLRAYICKQFLYILDYVLILVLMEDGLRER